MPTVSAETTIPKSLDFCCTEGVAPSQYPTLRSVTKPPTTERAVHTTQPMSNADIIPMGPLSPAATNIPADKIRVMSVMPDTGLVPTVAMACAATVVNRKEITITTISAIAALPKGFGCPLSTTIEKNRNRAMATPMRPMATHFIEKS
ncbi:MAG: hypothetical protein ACD_62C00527G0002 [uncultured bacterium]|nr:MAG: hypothetical protein ACD_62C00527G0002 [uncultured bacterium]